MTNRRLKNDCQTVTQYPADYFLPGFINSLISVSTAPTILLIITSLIIRPDYGFPATKFAGKQGPLYQIIIEI